MATASLALCSGVLNLGFVAVRRTKETQAFLRWWWDQRLPHGKCLVYAPAGLMTDQKWIDLVSSLFPSVAIFRDPGHNVACWNLDHRTIAWVGEHLPVNGKPLTFFHFSGFDPAQPSGAVHTMLPCIPCTAR